MAAQGQLLATQCTRIAGCSTRADDGCARVLLAAQCTRIAGCSTRADDGCARAVVGYTVHKDSWLQH